MILYTKSHLTIAEFYYDEPSAPVAADIVRYFFRSGMDNENATLRCSSVVNLASEPAGLLARMSRSTRTQIRKAETEGLRVEHCSAPDRSQVLDFCDFYDRFARTKGLWKLNRDHLAAVAEAKRLSLSAVTESKGETLVRHAHYVDGRWALNMHSAALFRDERYAAMANFIGRANRLLHWRDMLRFREAGVLEYDLCGWYEGDDPGQLKINQFKAGFGGRLVRYYLWDEARTLRGSLGLTLRIARSYLRQKRARAIAEQASPIPEPSPRECVRALS